MCGVCVCVWCVCVYVCVCTLQQFFASACVCLCANVYVGGQYVCVMHFSLYVCVCVCAFERAQHILQTMRNWLPSGGLQHRPNCRHMQKAPPLYLFAHYFPNARAYNINATPLHATRYIFVDWSFSEVSGLIECKWSKILFNKDVFKNLCLFHD